MESPDKAGNVAGPKFWYFSNQSGKTVHWFSFTFLSHYLRVKWLIVVTLGMEGILHRKKRLTTFPFPAGMSLTKLSVGGNNGEFGK
jgi:hypothetical protein